jgi:hypothetical protein
LVSVCGFTRKEQYSSRDPLKRRKIFPGGTLISSSSEGKKVKGRYRCFCGPYKDNCNRCLALEMTLKEQQYSLVQGPKLWPGAKRQIQPPRKDAFNGSAVQPLPPLDGGHLLTTSITRKEMRISTIVIKVCEWKHSAYQGSQAGLPPCSKQGRGQEQGFGGFGRCLYPVHCDMASRRR